MTIDVCVIAAEALSCVAFGRRGHARRFCGKAASFECCVCECVNGSRAIKSTIPQVVRLDKDAIAKKQSKWPIA